jgi:hypothetical protein
MMALRWLWLLVLGFGLAGSPAPARGQDEADGDLFERLHRSHLPITPPGEGGQGVEDALNEKLRKVKALRDARALAEDMLKHPEKYKDLPDLEKLRERVGKGESLQATDPDVQRLLRQLLDKNQQGGGLLTPEQAETLRGVLPPPAEPPAEGPRPPQALTPPRGSMPGPQPEPGEMPQRGASRGGPRVAGPEQPKQPAEMPSEPPAQARQPSSGSRLAEQFARFADRLRGLDSTLRNSPAFQQALRDLRNFRNEENDRWSDLAGRLNEWSDRLPRIDWNPREDEIGSLAERVAGWLPSMNFSVKGGPAGSGFGAPDLPSSNDLGGMLTVLGVVAAGFLAWVLLARARGLVGGGSDAERRLGPWPVNPAAVRTREDLIRAFEYLSLLRLGLRARHWNHREIAAQLAAQPAATSLVAAERDHAVAHLAGLYEQARYAPPFDPWSDEDLAAARLELCSLAGVAAA